MSVIVLSEYKALCLVDYSNAFSFISFPSVFYIYIFYIYVKETGAETVLQTQREYSDAELDNITKLICFWSTNACKPI